MSVLFYNFSFPGLSGSAGAGGGRAFADRTAFTVAVPWAGPVRGTIRTLAVQSKVARGVPRCHARKDALQSVVIGGRWVTCGSY